MQSCRGTFGSTGKFDPHHDEQRDGLATLEWIKQQPWCDGSIGTFGMSYLGYTQWAVAAAAGPEVKAMAMQVTLSDFSQMTYGGDSFALENALTWTQMVTLMKTPLGMLRIMLSLLLAAQPFAAEQWLTSCRWRSMDEKVVGERVGFWQDWVQARFRGRSLVGADEFSRIDQGHQTSDHDGGWMVRHFSSLADARFHRLAAGRCEARITIGPWRHTDMELGQPAMHDAIDWFDRHLRGKDGAPERKAVKLYVIGADEWREFDEWPPREARVEQWYLQPQRKLLDRIAPDSQADQYRYDPADPTPSLGGPALEATPYSVDNTAARGTRGCADVHVGAAASASRHHRHRCGRVVRLFERTER